MKLAVLAVLIIAAVSVRADDWSPFGQCSRECDGGIATRTCLVAGGDCPGVSAQLCGTTACVNCTVTPYWTSYSSCTKPCGKGTTWRARSITQEPGIGGSPCPQLNFTYDCNTDMCYATLYSKGFYFWGPFKGPGPLSYTIRRYNTEVDAFLFTQENFIQYQYDANRMKPYQTNYQAIRATLDIETVKAEYNIALDPNTNYYLVVDHTLIGAAKGTTDGNGDQVFLENRFYYEIVGLDPGQGYESTPNISAAPRAAGVTAFAALVAIVAALFL